MAGKRVDSRNSRTFGGSDRYGEGSMYKCADCISKFMPNSDYFMQMHLAVINTTMLVGEQGPELILNDLKKEG